MLHLYVEAANRTPNPQKQKDPGFIIVPGLVPLVSKETGEIEYVVVHLPEVVAPRRNVAGERMGQQYNYPRIVDQYLEIYKTARKQPPERPALS